MRRAALLVGLVICMAWVSQIAPTNAQANDRTCRGVETRSIRAKEILSDHSVGCSKARSVIKKYFHLVEGTAQTNGGCAQERSTSGCLVGAYECFSEYRQITERIWGQCYGTKSSHSFSWIEVDRSSN
jgi:hypothetical protein